MRRSPEQLAAAHHLRTVARRGDAERTAKARELKQQADDRAKRRTP
ncbi:hypothetical protein ACWGH2_29255 [Streptomyces sp. NPDC054871]